jgi:hypothetical protein
MTEGTAAMSDLLLQIVAIRLAALVLAALLLRALPEPHHAPSPAPLASPQHQVFAPHPARADAVVALALHDMRLYD